MNDVIPIDDFIMGLLKCCKVKHRLYKTYLLKDKSTRLYKIGRAVDVNKRVRSLEVANPNLSIVITIEKDVEKELHNKYSSKRIKSEWFKLSKEDVDEIKRTYL